MIQGTNANPMNAEVLCERLESLLDSLAAAYTRLGEQAAAHREAIRNADAAAIGLATAAQSRSVEILAKLEQERRELVAAACTRFVPLAGKRATAITLTDLCACVPAGEQKRLKTRSNDLRTLIERVNEETNTIRAATVSLVAHMEGLMRQVGRQLSHAGTYTRRGYVEAGGMVVSALDLRS
ncbi:MAG TPA: flagellar export chaperone FlgN [Phycisphaerales bacterium]|nr:flagellar export chaperone FlgN [Phycisphaerales bacterium]